MIIKAFDQSLTCTGIARIDTETGAVETSTFTPKIKGHDRLEQVWQHVHREVTREPVAAVAMEGISYGSPDQGRQIAGLSWFLRHELWRIGITPVEITPGSLKLYATGSGASKKDVVLLSIIRRFPMFTGGNDEADALVMAAMVSDRLGSPIVQMPQTHRRGLDKVKWPAGMASNLPDDKSLATIG